MIDTHKYSLRQMTPHVWRIACLDCNALPYFGCYSDMDEYAAFHMWECPTER